MGIIIESVLGDDTTVVEDATETVGLYYVSEDGNGILMAKVLAQDPLDLSVNAKIEIRVGFQRISGTLTVDDPVSVTYSKKSATLTDVAVSVSVNGKLLQVDFTGVGFITLSVNCSMNIVRRT